MDGDKNNGSEVTNIFSTQRVNMFKFLKFAVYKKTLPNETSISIPNYAGWIRGKVET